jgi:hypothetical protein
MRTICLLIAVAAGVGPTACVDIRDYESRWRGAIVPEAVVRQGFTANVTVDPLELTNVDLQGLTARLTTSDGKFKAADLTSVVKFSADNLASLDFDGNPLRSYLLYARLSAEPTACPAQMVISLFSDDHVELRVIRGNDLFGIFSLRRIEEDEE